jgi:DNA-binding winged helix-turn-helix (wHTH) protein/Tol biopolymer transport system component
MLFGWAGDGKMITTKGFVFRFSDVEVHEDERRATRNGQALDIEPKAFRVLVYLVRHSGHLVSKSELMDVVWGETAVTENSLTRAVALLRRVLEDDPHEPHFIETVSTAGYRFICPVTQDSDGSSSHAQSSASPSTAATEQPPLNADPAITATARLYPRHRRGVWVLAAGLAVAICVAAAWFVWFSAPRTLVVTSIEPVTHDGWTKFFLTSDGNRLYFVEDINWAGVLKQVSVGGGESSTIPTSVGDPFLYDIAPDRSALLVSDWASSTPMPLWSLSLPQEVPRKVGNVTATGATFTPNGKHIIFSKGAEIWISDVDGSQMRRLWTAPGYVSWFLKTSPDGKRMRLPVCGPSGCTIWELNTDGSGAHSLLPDWQPHSVLGEGSWIPEGGGSWSPDGRYYVFGASNPADKYFRYDLWLIPGTRRWFSRRPQVPVQLTRGPAAIYPPVVFSPDGRTIFAPGIQWGEELARYDPNTHQTTPYLSGIPAILLAFSNDGQWISYVMPDYSLWRCRRDGSDRVQLTFSRDSAVRESRWSPDGTRIAFEWRRAGKPSTVGLIPRDGGTPEQVIPDSEAGDSQLPTWSPDGERIIFSRQGNGPGDEMWDLASVDLRTRKVTPIPDSKGLRVPRSSPDGRYVAALCVDFHCIRLFDFQKKLWTNWFTAAPGKAPGFADWLLWSRDSKTLYFFNYNATYHLEVWRLDLGRPTPTRIAEVPEERFFFWQQGPTMAPDGGIIYTRNLSKSEIYALHLSEK